MSRRSDRVSGLLQREIGRLVDEQVQDPRLVHLVTVSHVAVSADLAQATIAVTVLGGDNQQQGEVMRGLISATGYVRRELGRRINLKRTPEIRFVRDTSIEDGNRVLEVLNSIQPDGLSE